MAIFLCFFFLGYSCNERKLCSRGSHKTLRIQNNSTSAVNWIREDFSDSNDSVWSLNGSTLDRSYGQLDAGKSVDVGAARATCWEDYLSETGVYEYFYIFSHDTVVAIGWENISGTNRGLVKKVKVDISYLRSSNLIIFYP